MPSSTDFDVETLARAVEALWHGLDEDVRRAFSGVHVDGTEDPSATADSPAVVVTPGRKGGPGKLVIVYAAFAARVAADPELAWRSALARAMRRAAVDAVGRGRAPRPSEPAPPANGPPVEAPGRMSYIEMSVAMDPFAAGRQTEAPPSPGQGGGAAPIPFCPEPDRGGSIPPGWAAPAPARRTPTPPANADRGKRSFGAGLARVAMAPWRAAFGPRRPARTLPGKVAIALLRGGTALSYVVFVVGLGYLVWYVAVGPRMLAAGGPEAASAVRSAADAGPEAPTGQRVETRDVAGHAWLVPAGWSVEESGAGGLRLEGPSGGQIQVRALPEGTPREALDRARLCVGERRAQVIASVGEAGSVEARYFEGDALVRVRCLFRGDWLVRAEAPWATYGREHLEDWLLLVALGCEWNAQGEGGPAPRDGGGGRA